MSTTGVKSVNTV